MAGRHQRLVWTQWTRPVPPSARPTDMEETNPYSGWPQRAISLWDIMNHESYNAIEKITFVYLISLLNNHIYLDMLLQSLLIHDQVLFEMIHYQDQLDRKQVYIW
ncbi:unnamed protein product [Rotaria magnacalcarata]|uniref:Uncharacterized protein n=1 Tax=Rotaria magnacalcarata TaxID=392030 RepID=A0A820FH00_9BILA|nr:unnamed protein product [Rotaria magnacalcarata]